MSEMVTKSFHIGDILSITTGRLVSLEHIGGVYKILGWMTGEDLMTHQLPRVSDECAPALREQFPDLAEISAEGVTITSEVECVTWLASLEPKYGTRREVRPLDPADHTRIDPISEIKMKRPDLPIIGVEL